VGGYFLNPPSNSPLDYKGGETAAGVPLFFLPLYSGGG